MSVDELLAEIAEIGWSLRYLQQDWNCWAAMLYRGPLSTPRRWGRNPTEALANAIEAIELATKDEPAPIYTPPKPLDLEDLVGIARPTFKLRLSNAQNKDNG